jgi:hypothetical protein
MNLLPRLTPEQLEKLFAETLAQLEAEAAKQSFNIELVFELASRLNMLRFLMQADRVTAEEERTPKP